MHEHLARFAAACAAALLLAPAAPAEEDASRYVVFIKESTGDCVARNGMRILVRSTHSTRRVRVWLDRYVMGVGTGDRSRSDLTPGAEPVPLGCSRNQSGTQEWRIVRATFVY